MFSFIQILIYVVSLYHVMSTPIFGEFRIKKGFEIEHKAPPIHMFKPFEMVKEFVSPFGMFGMKHVIGKRDLDNMKTIDVDGEPEKVSLIPPPKSENRYEVYETTQIPPVLGPVTPGLGPVIENSPVTPQVPHFVEIKPIPAPPPPPVVITPPPPKVEQHVPIVQQEPPKGFLTDISRDEAVKEYMKIIGQEPVGLVENVIEPEKPKEVPKFVEPPKVEEPPSPFVRGSRLALYFGNLMLDMFSRFLGGGQLAEVINRPLRI